MSTVPRNLPFSKLRRAGGLLFLSGELPFGPDGGIPDGITAQTDLVMARIAATLAGENLTLEDIVSVLVHLAKRDDFEAFNLACARHLAEPYPVRTTVVAELAVDALMEISVVVAEHSPSAGGERGSL